MSAPDLESCCDGRSVTQGKSILPHTSFHPFVARSKLHCFLLRCFYIQVACFSSKQKSKKKKIQRKQQQPKKEEHRQERINLAKCASKSLFFPLIFLFAIFSGAINIFLNRKIARKMFVEDIIARLLSSLWGLPLLHRIFFFFTVLIMLNVF